MPPKGEKLSDQQIADLTEWVKMGAPDPRSAGSTKLTGLTDKARAHWAYQPVKDPAVPEVQTKGWVKTPVDAFIARAQADVKAAQSQLELSRNRAMAEVEAAYAAFQAARDQVQTFRNELLNEADESRSIALAAYQEGATQLLPLLDAQRTRTEVRQQYFRTLFDYQTDLIDLELAVGKELQ